MSHLKKILNIESFSSVVGCAQPTETCPMIDDHILDLNAEIESAKSEISNLEAQLSELDEDSSPADKNRLESELSSLDDNISDYTNKIQELEDDRKMIRDARQYSLSCRDNILEMLDSAIVHVNGFDVFLTEQLTRHQSSKHPYSSKYLKSSYKDVEKNYESIIDWGIAWDESLSLFIDLFENKIDVIPFSKQKLDRFFELVKRIDNHIVMNDLLNRQEVKELMNLVEECQYEGMAFRSIYMIGDVDLQWSDNFQNICWSKTSSSINKVISSQHHRPTTIKTFKAKVSGLDLGNLIEKFPRIFHNLNYGEDEILAIEYEQLEQIEI